MKIVNNIFTVKRLYECCGSIYQSTLFVVYSHDCKKVYEGSYIEMPDAFKNQEVETFDIDARVWAVTVVLMN